MRRAHALARAGTLAPAKAASAAPRRRSSPGPAPRLASPRAASPGPVGAAPPGGAAVARAATQARGLRAARPRAPSEHDRASAPARSRARAGAAAAAARVWRPPEAPLAPVPAPSRVGERASWRVQRAQAPGPRPAFAPPLAALRPTWGPPAKGHVPTAAARARRVPAGSAALPALGRALRATSGSDAAAPRAPLAMAWQRAADAGGRQRDVAAGTAPARPRGLPRGPTPAGSREWAARAGEPCWPGPRHRPHALARPGLPRLARALAPGERWAEKQARSARAFWAAPAPAAVAAGSAPRRTGCAAATAAARSLPRRQTAVAARLRKGGRVASGLPARRGAAAERPRRTPWRPPSPPPSPQAALGRRQCRHRRGRAAPACLRLPHLSRFSPFSGQSPFAACAGGQKKGMQQHVPDRQCSIREIWGKHGIPPTT